MKPLKSFRVLDLTNVLAGPFCCHQLAHLGAEVIKIEVPGRGDLARQLGADPELNEKGMGVSFLAQNAGKRSLTLNLKHPEGREVFFRLVSKADVVVENFRPGVMERLGLGFEKLKEVNPSLVYCAISGFGQNGPLKDSPAYDQIIQGLSGVMAVTGNDESGPLRVGFPMADTIGGITAALGITASLSKPEREAVFIDVSMLESMGLPEEDFNSYATHRGDHLTALRATFANPKLLNEMCRDESGEVIQGSLARIEPEGKQTRMWEAIETYMERKQPLIIVAGADYGQGSSRDWAAKGVRLAGVETIVAEGFERIHRTNLVGMGILPLEFKNGDTRESYAIDGTETFDVEGEITPRSEMTLMIHRTNGERIGVPVISRLDTAEEVSVYVAGGVLQRFAQDFLAGNASAKGSEI